MKKFINLEVLKSIQEMGGDDTGFVFRIIDSFLQEVSPRLLDLQNQQRAGQAEAMGHTAHALASSALNLGLDPLAALCSELDRKGRGGSLVNSDVLTKQITDGFQEAIELLAAIVKRQSID